MKEAIWIYTTVKPQGILLDWNIYGWHTFLNVASLNDLHQAADALEARYQSYVEKNKTPAVSYHLYEMNAQAAHFYHRLVVDLHKEIARRIDPSEFVNPN